MANNPSLTTGVTMSTFVRRMTRPTVILCIGVSMSALCHSLVLFVLVSR